MRWFYHETGHGKARCNEIKEIRHPPEVREYVNTVTMSDVLSILSGYDPARSTNYPIICLYKRREYGSWAFEGSYEEESHGVGTPILPSDNRCPTGACPKLSVTSVANSPRKLPDGP